MGNRHSSNKLTKSDGRKQKRNKSRNQTFDAPIQPNLNQLLAEDEKAEEKAPSNALMKPPRHTKAASTGNLPYPAPTHTPSASPSVSPSGSPRGKHQPQRSAPPSIESFLAKQNKKRRKLPALPKFGAPLAQQPLRELDEDTDYKLDSIVLKDDYGAIPVILISLKKYLLKFQGYQQVGLFANGDIANIGKYHVSPAVNQNSPKDAAFVDGVASKVDVLGFKQLIESNKMEQFAFGDYSVAQERHYALIFAELIKLWMQCLHDSLLGSLPSTFFADVSSTDLFSLEIDKVPEPNLSALLFLLDICVETVNNCTVNQMNAKRLATVIGPYLYRDKDVERNQQLKPALISFCEIGIEWRMHQH